MPIIAPVCRWQRRGIKPPWCRRAVSRPLAVTEAVKSLSLQTVRRLAWQSVSKIHNLCVFMQICGSKITDSLMSLLLGMTG